MLLILSAAAVVAFGPLRPPPRPELVGPGVISTPDDEFGFALTPDGKTAYFVKRTPTTNTRPRSTICVSRLRGGRWSEPEVASFSGTYNDVGAAVSPDGRRLVFASDRPSVGDSCYWRSPFDIRENPQEICRRQTAMAPPPDPTACAPLDRRPATSLQQPTPMG